MRTNPISRSAVRLPARLLTLTALTAALFAVAASATHSGTYHWARSSNPLVLKLGDNVSSTWDPSLQSASADWGASSVVDTVIVSGGTTPRQCQAAAGRVEVCSAAYGQTGWLSLVSISVGGSHITAASVRFNDTYFGSSPYNTSAWRTFMMCHELGHVLGLADQDSNPGNPNLGSCMDLTSSPDTNQHPNAHDYQQLETIYNSHLDAPAALPGLLAPSTPPAMEQLALDGPGQWGRVVASDEVGRPSLYELDFGAGYRIFTRVHWAPASH
jgi:hypothetical protein